MAVVADGFELVLTLMDTAGDTTLLTYPLTSADLDAAVIDAAAIIGSIGVLSLAVLTQYKISSKFINNAVVYPVGAEVEDEAFLTGKIVGHPNKSGSIRIPAPVPALFTATEGPGRNIVLVTYAPLVTYLGFFDGSGPVTVSDGEALVLTSVTGKRRKKGSKIG